jgi:tRNA threonylcarbamoyladenosine biosynthesis protein TsaB
MELSIDTSTRYASVALSRQGELVTQSAWRSERNHSVEFVPALRHLLERATVEVEDLRAIYVANGPGGFSALRVGISVAQTLAMAKGIPLVAVGTLEIEAYPYLGLGMPVCALIDASRKDLYAATYGPQAGNGGQSGPDRRVVPRQELASLAQEATLFCGEGVFGAADLLREGTGSKALVVETPPPTRTASVLAHLGYRQWQASNTVEPEDLQPVYMKGAQFETARRRPGTDRKGER